MFHETNLARTGNLLRLAVQKVKACLGTDPLNHTTFVHDGLRVVGLICCQAFLVEKRDDLEEEGPHLKQSGPLEGRGIGMLLRVRRRECNA